MSVTQEQIQNIAKKLSKLPGDNDKLAGNIQDILGYMELLEEVDTSGIVGTVSVINNEKEIRTDTLKDKKTSPKDLLDCSHQKVVGGNIILPNIMK